MAASASPALTRGSVTRSSVLARFRSRVATTPGRMRLASTLSVIALLLLAVIATGALRARQHAASAVGQQAEPLLVGAEVIYSSLADADATATNTFLKPGGEPPARRQAYLDDLTTAANQLATVARQAGSSKEAAQALSVINKDLPTYSGRVEAARANNRLGLPVGAAYLREGSTLMQTGILPAVRQLYQVEAGRLSNAYASGQSALDIIGVALAAALALAVLALTQAFLARRTNRLVNPALAGATLAIFVLLGWALVAFWASGNRLHAARVNGSDHVQLLSSTRILISRAQADESLFLVARGSGTQYQSDFDAVAAALRPAIGAGLLAQADRAAPQANLDGLYSAYLQSHDAMIHAATFAKAVDVATGTGPTDELTTAVAVNTALGTGIDNAQKGFQTRSTAARNDLAFLSLGAIGLIVAAAGLVIAGLEQRINEYR